MALRKHHKGNRMKTAEEYFKERYSAVYSEDKHERKIHRFDYYDMTDFAAQYASEAIREKDELFEVACEVHEFAGIILTDVKDLREQLAAKDKEIEQLRETLENLALAVKHDASDLVVRTRTNTAFEVLAQNAHAEPSGKTEPFTGPVVGIEDGTEFNNGR
jgi:predicted DNA-binding protein (UPF0251 family)